MGGHKVVQVAYVAALNSKSKGLYQRQVRRNKRMQGFMHVKISVYFLSFSCMPHFSMKAAQSFVHEAPGVFPNAFLGLAEMLDVMGASMLHRGR